MDSTTTPATGAEQAPPAAAPAAAPPVDQGPVFKPGTKLREYETVFLLRPDMPEDQADKVRERFRGIVAREGGKVVKFTTWGRKKVQYEVKKQNRAVFVHMLYLGPSAIVKEIERNLRLMDDVLRYQTVKLAEETDANRPVEQDVKLAGDAEQDRPFREERPERREEAADTGEKTEESEPEETA